MTIYDLKPKFQNLLRPLCRSLAKRGVTANAVTITAIFLSLFGGICVWFAQKNLQLLWIVPIILFMRMALNAIDGILAREHKMQSSLGAILNELGDIVSDIFLYAPFAYLAGLSVELVLAIVFCSLIIEMTGVVSIQIGGSRRYDGPFGKSDRAFLFGLLAILLAFGFESSLWLNGLLVICLFLSLMTIFNRAKRALSEVKKESK